MIYAMKSIYKDIYKDNKYILKDGKIKFKNKHQNYYYQEINSHKYKTLFAFYKEYSKGKVT